ncbi:hypothetical protein ANCCEY_14303 [Ancylostoma ceylanicum]|uniref:Reverse transcriptase domain-containing protein n=1 Tax=Ancylostoma ceylanicum TaxID=53326 RepID=A0A0D6L5A6_9BILA|nr:hypothetical protein ANCCEY_14303 [Ancylostoma ceylanicum]
MPLCLMSIDLRKAFDTVETEAVLEALINQDQLHDQNLAILRRQHHRRQERGSTRWQERLCRRNIFTATLEDVMQRLEWNNMVVRVDGRLLHHLRFADDVLITPKICQAERMLAGLELNLTKTMFMRNGRVRMPHSRSTERPYTSAPATYT